jgi:hypothetical protein
MQKMNLCLTRLVAGAVMPASTAPVVIPSLLRNEPVTQAIEREQVA